MSMQSTDEIRVFTKEDYTEKNICERYWNELVSMNILS